MKSNKSFRGPDSYSGANDSHRGTKLAPIKKSGKERHILYSSLEEEDDEPAYQSKRESVFDYFDDDEQ